MVDDIVMEYLKKVKCEKTSKMFGTEGSDGSDHNRTLKKFIEFVKQNESNKETSVQDDLGFEINFGAFQPEKKLPRKKPRKPLTETTNQGSKKEAEKRKIDIPKDFIKKIKNLGMNVEDAEILFKSGIDWTAVYSKNKIYCPDIGCDYSTTIGNEDLANHMIKEHKYGDYPCTYDHCDYVAVSKKTLNRHRLMHKNLSENNGWYKCLKPNCQSAFAHQGNLDVHMRIHNNQLDKCDYCQYRYIPAKDYRDHLNKHFRIEFKCDECSATFTSKANLVQHSTMHEGITYCCLICKTYKTATKHNITRHFKRYHSDLLGNTRQWESVKEYVKLK